MSLFEQKCEPCRIGTPPLSLEESQALLTELSSEWHLENEHLVRQFRFADFKSALAFTNKVGNVAENEGHHPDILLSWGRVKITLWTHKIKGLSKSDFILAAKIDKI